MQLDSDTNIKDDLGGAMSVKFKPGSTINEFCARHLQDFNPEQHELVAMRVFFGREAYVTLYALDRNRMKGDNFSEGKMPVKKFRLSGQFMKEMIPFIEECNFTLTTGIIPLERMEVINK